MSWTAPKTYVAGDVLTAAELNTYQRDNMTILGASAAALVATSETETNTSYDDMTTAGPAVTVTTGTKALVIIGGLMYTGSAGGVAYMSFAVSGATTLAADDTRACEVQNAASYANRISRVVFLSALTAGSNTFTAKYKTSTGTATFADRTIAVIPIVS